MRDPIYICVACYHTASRQPGVCPRCQVDRLALADPRVRDELRAEAERRVQKRAYRAYFWITAGAFVITLPLFPYQILFIPIFWILAAFGLSWVGTTAYRALRPKSALALLRARKQRLAYALAPGPEDPEDADDPERLLAWLGTRVEP
jgi:hypothetical protein